MMIVASNNITLSNVNDGKIIHIAYANSADGKDGFSTTDSTNKSYLGTYTDFMQADSKNPSDYNWSLIKGADGKDGPQGIPGPPGADGKTSYLHIAYSNSADGSGCVTSPDINSSYKYIGTYTDYTSTSSTNPSSYKWVAMFDSTKKRNFTSQPTTPYAVGDTWTESDATYFCTTARDSGAFSANDWKMQQLTIHSLDSNIQTNLNNSVKTTGNYKGVTLNDNGLTATAGSTTVAMNSNDGFLINNDGGQVFHVDTSGNLTMNGDITAGDSPNSTISGVNFTGNNLTLAGDLQVNGGQILLGDGTTTLATLDSNGLSIKGAGLSISDKDGNQTTYVKDDGTFTTNKGAFTGNVTATSLTIPEGSSADINVAGKFMVNSTGDVTANSISITGDQNSGVNNSASLNGVSIYNGSVIEGNTIVGGNIIGSEVIGANLYALATTDNKSLNQPINSLDDVDDTNTNWFKINGNILEWHYAPDEYASIGPGLGYIKYHFNAPPDSNNQTQGLTITDTKCITLSTGQQVHYQDNSEAHTYIKPIKNNWNMGWANETRLEVTPDEIKATLSNRGGSVPGSVFTIQKDDRVGIYIGGGDTGNHIDFVAAGDGAVFDVNTSLLVHGSKNAVVPTSQGTVAINAYETAEYYFGDIGEDQTNGDGKVWVSIDYLFGQTVNTSVPYQVFVTPYSSAHVWVSKRLKNRFLVESDKPSASFAWEIKAKRKGYEHTRLKNVDNMMEKPAGVK